MNRVTITSPIGNLLLDGDGERLTGLRMVGADTAAPQPPRRARSTPSASSSSSTSPVS